MITKLYMATKKAVRKVVKKRIPRNTADVQPIIISGVDGSKIEIVGGDGDGLCPTCEGTGLLDRATLCEPCLGSGSL